MVLGIICEFNPFHGGHRYLIDRVKKDENDIVICAMSPNFVQRGDFAVYDKYTRAKTALENGADIVIEIPTVCAVQSAQGFARAGVKILESTGICDAIAFGAECDDVQRLKAAADKILECDSLIKEELKKGVSYPKARQNIVCDPVLETPNNILAVEYLTCTKLNPIAVRRIGLGHDSEDEQYSASQIRKGLDTGKISSIQNCESAVLYKLRAMSAADFRSIEDVSEGLENRIVNAVRTSSTLEEIYDKIKTKRYTMSRIRRIILRAFLSITKEYAGEPLYLHILGFSEKGMSKLAQMKKNAVLPIISKYSDIYKLDTPAREMYEQECRFTDLHSLGFSPARPCGREQQSKIILAQS